MATDQPIRPMTPRPNQMPAAGLRRALSLRAAIAAICSEKVGFSTMLKGAKSMQKPGFQLRHDRACAVFLDVQSQKLSFNRLVQLTEIGAADGAAHGYEHVRTGFYQYAFVHRRVRFASRGRFVDQDSWCQCRHAIASMGQKAEGALAHLGDDAQHARDIGKDLKW